VLQTADYGLPAPATVWGLFSREGTARDRAAGMLTCGHNKKAANRRKFFRTCSFLMYVKEITT
jgi:hypothetical protein